MRIEQLYYLSEIAKTKSINLTAEQIYVSQPSISEAIQKLEKELGVVLLYRSSQGVILTDDGQKVVKRAREILKILEDLKLELSQQSPNNLKLKGSLLISYVPILNFSFLDKSFSTFIEDYPDVNIIIKEQRPGKLISDIKAGKTDLGIIMIPDLLPENSELWDIRANKKILFEKLYTDKLIVGIGKTSSLATKKYITIKQLLKHPIAIYVSDQEENWLLNYLNQNGKPQRLLMCESSKIYKKLIIEGSAAGFFSKSTLKEDPLYKEIIPLPIKNCLQLSFGWIRLNDHPFTQAAQEFIRIMKTYC